MSLSKTLTTKHGITVAGAILRVDKVSITDKEEVSFVLRSYVSADKPFFEQREMTAPYKLDGANPFKQAYEHLKTLPEFEGAVDC